LSRNRITQAGGEAILQTLKETIRILDLELNYGNRITPLVDFDIVKEL
jgi:Ran GTPase-activating protein (RanGAP) involved in mRNA processing and transport